MAYLSKEAAAEKRAKLKALLPAKDGWKFSFVNRDKMTADFTFVQGPHEFISTRTSDGQPQNKVVTEAFINHFYVEGRWDAKSVELINKVLAILNEGNHDNSDIQSDYFDVGFYIDLHIGSWEKDYVKV